MIPPKAFSINRVILNKEMPVKSPSFRFGYSELSLDSSIGCCEPSESSMYLSTLEDKLERPVNLKKQLIMTFPSKLILQHFAYILL